MRYTALILSAALATAAFASPATDAAKLLERYSAAYVTNGINTWTDANIILSVCKTNSAIAAEVDALLAQKPPKFTIRRNFDIFPRAKEACLEILERDYPVFVAKIRNPAALSGAVDYTQHLLESAAIIGYVTEGHINTQREKMLRFASKRVVRKMRSEGLPVVGERGRAVMQQRLDALAAAFDAPLFNGMSNALATCGIDIKVPASYPLVPQGEKLTKLMDDIYNGDREFTAVDKWRLRIALGLAEYNSFVQRYNGDMK